MRTTVLGLAAAFTTVLAFLTLMVLIDSGPDVLTILSLLVLALFLFGILGALTAPPDRRR